MSIHIITYECIKFNRILIFFTRKIFHCIVNKKNSKKQSKVLHFTRFYSIILYENGIYTIINKNYK